MAEIVNLRQARKRAARAAKDAEAEANRRAFGTPRAVKHAAEQEKAREARHLDGHRLNEGRTGPDDGR
ncbi:hypothetical protein GCM10011390_08490 [Aureimonas endophytica]|uniref:DUF4169 family protein n=1 Tax=Aureimonas endophytica TaxID=2027858 RepID=A0A917E0P2_9HYPH|nr:DUF4169 family protein [Aureimonas endophytica]GGD92057.1 hypothetical protein GCM10011390_08490 [Aureimonas endophytica]